MPMQNKLVADAKASDPTGDDVDNHPLMRIYLGTTRFGLTVGIAAISILAFALFVYASMVVARELWEILRGGWPDSKGSKHLAVVAVETTDVILLGTVLNIVALGLLQLFVLESLTPRLRPWLRVVNLDQLKDKLMGVVSVLLAVSFLAQVVEWDHTNNVLYLGLAIASVIVAMAIYSFVIHRTHEHDIE
jgi:uncharacterized membrane protein YqhA